MAKSSLEFIRFEAEIENYGSMDQVLAKLDMKTIKLSGFHELLKVRVGPSLSHHQDSMPGLRTLMSVSH